MNRRVSKIPGRGLPLAEDCGSLVLLPSSKFPGVSESLRKRQLPSQRGLAELSGGLSVPCLQVADGQVQNSRRLFPSAGNTKTTRRRVGIVASRRPPFGPPPASRTARDRGGQTQCGFRCVLFLSNLSPNRVLCKLKQLLLPILWRM